MPTLIIGLPNKYKKVMKVKGFNLNFETKYIKMPCEKKSSQTSNGASGQRVMIKDETRL